MSLLGGVIKDAKNSDKSKQPSDDSKLTEDQIIVERISNEILNTKNPMNVLFSVLSFMDKKDDFTTYVVSRRFPQDVRNFYITDLGYIGLADRSIPPVGISFGDIIIFALSYKLATGDMAQVMFKTDDNLVDIRHFKIENFTSGGLVEVSDPSINVKYTISQWQILGKMIKIVKFGTREWKELFDRFPVGQQQLKKLMDDAIPLYEKSDNKYKGEILKELHIRVTKLSAMK